MRRVMFGMLVVVLLMGVTGCFGATSQSAKSPVPSPTSGIAVAAVREVPAPDMYVLSLALPSQLQVNTSVDVSVALVGAGEVSELAFALHFPLMYLYVDDADSAMAGAQGRPGSLPPTATILENAVTADGVYHYRVTGLGAGDKLKRQIVTLRVWAVSASEIMIPVKFTDMVLLGKDGQPLPLTPQSALVSITEEGAATPTGPATSVSTESSPATPLPTPPPPLSTPTPPPPAPTAVPQPPAPPVSGIAPGLYYRIRRGETLYRLAYRYGTTAAAIAAANGITDVTTVSVSRLLHIPIQPANGQALYIVTPGDTFYNIARTFGLSTQKLAARNPLIAPHYVQPGQWIVLVP